MIEKRNNSSSDATESVKDTPTGSGSSMESIGAGCEEELASGTEKACQSIDNTKT